jgi:hypothetical protein
MVSEGQRKAHYEELDGEKKRNKDRIKQLEKVIEDLYVQLSSTGQVCLLHTSGDSKSAVPEPLFWLSCGTYLNRLALQQCTGSPSLASSSNTLFSKGQNNAFIFFSFKSIKTFWVSNFTQFISSQNLYVQKASDNHTNAA